jgi:hypothetical protein
VRRRIGIIGLAAAAMFAAPLGLGAANAGPSVPTSANLSSRTVACLGNGSILNMSVCVPMPRL